MTIPSGFRSSSEGTLSSGAWPVTALFPPRQRKAFPEAILDEILEERVVSSRNRINPRGVKRKMSNYNLRPRKRQRTRHLDVAKRTRIVKSTVLGLDQPRSRVLSEGTVCKVFRQHLPRSFCSTEYGRLRIPR